MIKTTIQTPIGEMIAIAGNEALHLLEFTDRKNIDKQIERVRRMNKYEIERGENDITRQITIELAAYFKGTLDGFKTPVKHYGSEFQKNVLSELISIPYGQTRSYAEQAENIGNPKAVRAVARANGMNQLAIIIPCHRVIGSDGSLTGYAGGLARKEWLLKHESGNR